MMHNIHASTNADTDALMQTLVSMANAGTVIATTMTTTGTANIMHATRQPLWQAGCIPISIQTYNPTPPNTQARTDTSAADAKPSSSTAHWRKYLLVHKMIVAILLNGQVSGLSFFSFCLHTIFKQYQHLVQHRI